MSNEEIVQKLVEEIKRGVHNEEFYRTMYTPDAKSIESKMDNTMPQEYSGVDALIEKSKGWYEMFEIITSGVVEHSVVNTNQVIMTLSMDLKNKSTGEEMTGWKEYGLYTFTDGKISEEKFFSISG